MFNLFIMIYIIYLFKYKLKNNVTVKMIIKFLKINKQIMRSYLLRFHQFFYLRNHS